MHPFIDTTSMTDDEIMSRIERLTHYLGQQSMLGHNPTVQSIQEVIDTLIGERNSRFDKLIRAETAKKKSTTSNTITLGELDGPTPFGTQPEPNTKALNEKKR